MPTHYRWQKTISNGYATKVIRGASKADVEQRAAAQLAVWQQQAMQRQAKWKAQVARQAAQDQLRALEMQAQVQTEDAQMRLSNLSNLLRNGLGKGKHFDWNAAKDHRTFPAFQFLDSPPTYEGVARRFNVPARSALEALFASKARKREEIESQARTQFNAEHAAYEARKADDIKITCSAVQSGKISNVSSMRRLIRCKVDSEKVSLKQLYGSLSKF